MDQFAAALNTLLTAALAVFGAFLNFIVQILDFFLVLIRIVLTALHLQ
jgi:hypothetical protein